MSIRRIKNELKRFRKKVSRPIWLFLAKKKSWFKIFRETQKEIQINNPNPAYEVYEDKEIWFWIKMLDWIYDDNLKNNFKKCIDIGSAFGTLTLLTKKITEADLYAIDLSKNIAPELVQKYSINHEACNIEKNMLPWEGKFDCIIFNEIIEHLSTHPLKTLIKLRNHMSDNGILYLSTPDGKDYGRITDYFNSYKEMPQEGEAIDKTGINHIYHFTKEELVELFNEADLTIERFAYSPGITYRHLNFSLKKRK